MDCVWIIMDSHYIVSLLQRWFQKRIQSIHIANRSENKEHRILVFASLKILDIVSQPTKLTARVVT